MINDHGTMLHMVNIYALVFRLSIPWQNEPNIREKQKKYKISNMCLWLVEDYLKILKSTFFENFSSFFYSWIIWDRSIGKICKNLYIFSWKQVEFINMNEPRVCCAAVGTINYWENEVGPPHSSWPWNKLFGQL